MLNARLLKAASADPEELAALIPNHSLLSRCSPKVSFLLSAAHYPDMMKTSKASEAYAEFIENRWCQEYLPQWNSRLKWNQMYSQQLKNGELVWSVDDSSKCGQYKKTRAQEVYPGSDGIGRSLIVRKKNMMFRRDHQ